MHAVASPTSRLSTRVPSRRTCGPPSGTASSAVTTVSTPVHGTDLRALHATSPFWAIRRRRGARCASSSSSTTQGSRRFSAPPPCCGRSVAASSATYAWPWATREHRTTFPPCTARCSTPSRWCANTQRGPWSRSRGANPNPVDSYQPRCSIPSRNREMPSLRPESAPESAVPATEE